MTPETRICNQVGCNRAAVTSPSGVLFGPCPTCIDRIFHQAYAPKKPR